jgi:PAS domain S-box-containing protein
VVHDDRAGAKAHDATSAPPRSERNSSEVVRADLPLSDREERARHALEAAELGIWALDLRSGGFLLDEQARAHVGTEKELVSVEDIVTATHPDDRARVLRAFRTLDPAESHGRVSIEHRIVQPSGEVRWIWVCAQVKFTGEGAARRLSFGTATSQDITERKLAEQTLADSENRFRIIFEHAGIGVAMVDSETGRFVRVNERLAEIVGRTVEETLACSWRDLTPPEDRVAHQAAHVDLLAGPANRLELEKRYLRKDGTTVWVKITVSRTWSDSESRAYHVTIVEDINARKEAETALRASEERFRRLVENIDGVVFSTDLEGRITFASGGVARYGLTPAKVLGKPLDPLIHPDDLAHLKASRLARIAGAPAAPTEFRLVDPDGNVHHLVSRTQPMIVDGKVVGLTGVLGDRTLQRETEEQLRHAQKMEAVGRLAGGVAHDFNNLLNVIGIYSELALEQIEEGNPLRTDLGEIHKAGLRAQGLTRQLLAFSRRQIMKPEPIDLNALVTGVERMLGRVIGEDIELTFSPGTLRARTLADPGQIEQVLMNLVVNSRDAMPRGGRLHIETATVHVDEARAHASRSLPQGDYVTFSVSDTGTGMDEATRARIFEPFFTTKAAGKGTGLGLAMVYGIVEQSGGGVEVETALGVGTTFRIYLPVAANGTLAATAKEAVAKGGGAETVLVVEDEAALRQITTRVLKTAGYDVIAADGADEAIRLFEERRGKVKLLVTDIVMRGMDGLKLAELLRGKDPHLRVLYVSGYSDDAIANHGVVEAGIDLLEKPFTTDTLLTNVRRVLDQPHVERPRSDRRRSDPPDTE